MRVLILALLVYAQSLSAQFDSTAFTLAQIIQASSLHDHVYTLASPAYEGRETGTEGNRKAAEYIAGQFKSYGVNPIPGDTDYFQEVLFTTLKWSDITLSIAGEKVDHLSGFLCYPESFPLTPDSLHITSLYFLGYGIDDPAYSDYTGAEVRGKNILIFNREPLTKDGRYVITGTSTPSAWSSDVMKKIALAHDRGAASVWILDQQFRDHVSKARRAIYGGEALMGSAAEAVQDKIPAFLLSINQEELLLGKKLRRLEKLKRKMDASGKPVKMTVPVDLRWQGEHVITTMDGVNVLGYIPGTDPVKKNELVVVSAHYDHLGMRGSDIYFGADDNASGTSAVIEIAHAMQQAKTQGLGPRRSVLCLLVTGEEKGLLGSQYYAEHPVFPLASTVADINIDMIGRMDAEHTEPNYTYVIGSDRLSTALHEINERVNATYTHLQLDYTYNADDDPNRFYYRSDHYNFAKKGIPAIFYFSGVHKDYHRTTDTPDKIMFDKAVPIAQLAFYTAWELANRPERIKVDVTGRN